MVLQVGGSTNVSVTQLLLKPQSENLNTRLKKVFKRLLLFFFSEQSIAQARASVMLYNNDRKEWEHSGGSSGLSRVHVYHHPVNNTYRIVGRKVQDHTVCCEVKTSLLVTVCKSMCTV